MESNGVQSSEMDYCDSKLLKDEQKHDMEFSLNKDEMMTKSVPDLHNEAQVRCLKKKLVILDLNGVLVDLVWPPPNDHIADAIVGGVAMFKRPFCLEFLKLCFENFEVGIWSTRNKVYIESILDYLLGDMKHKLLLVWDDSFCTKTSFNDSEGKQKQVQFKDLRKIWDKQDCNLPWEKGYYNETNTLLVDDSPYKALFNPPHTSIFPHTFNYLNKSDNSLGIGGELHEYIGGMANVENMQKYVEENPFGQEAKANQSGNFFSKIIHSLQQ